jgi:hypothetical protein
VSSPLAVLLASLAAAWIPLGAALLYTVVALERPDPSVPDGDPCCEHPDAYGDVASYLAYAALWAVLAIGPLVLASGACFGVVHGRLPPGLLGRRAAAHAALWACAAAVVAGLLFAGG